MSEVKSSSAKRKREEPAGDDAAREDARAMCTKMTAALGPRDLSKLRNLLLPGMAQLVLDTLSRIAGNREEEINAKRALIRNEVDYNGFYLCLDEELYDVDQPGASSGPGISVMETTLRVNLECPDSVCQETCWRPRMDSVVAMSFVTDDDDEEEEGAGSDDDEKVPAISVYDLVGADHAKTPSWVKAAGIDLESSDLSDLSDLDLRRLKDFPAGYENWHILGSSRAGYHHSTAELPIRLYYRKVVCPPAGTEARVLVGNHGKVECVKLKFGEHDVRDVGDPESDLPICTRDRWSLQDAIVLKPLPPAAARILIVQHGHVEDSPGLQPGVAVITLNRPTMFEARLLQAVATYPLMCHGPCNDAVANWFWDRGHREAGAVVAASADMSETSEQRTARLMSRLGTECDFAIHCYYADDENCPDPNLETVLDYYRKNAEAFADCRKSDLAEDMEHCGCAVKTKGQVDPDSAEWPAFRDFWTSVDFDEYT